MEHWNIGTLEHWNTGTLEHWNIGTLEHWNIGTFNQYLVKGTFQIVDLNRGFLPGQIQERKSFFGGIITAPTSTSAGGPETPIKDSKVSIERYQRESSVTSSIHWKGKVENKSDVTAFLSFRTFKPSE